MRFPKNVYFELYNLNTKVTFYFEVFFTCDIFIRARWCFFAMRRAPWRAADVSRIIEEWETFLNNLIFPFLIILYCFLYLHKKGFLYVELLTRAADFVTDLLHPKKFK